MHIMILCEKSLLHWSLQLSMAIGEFHFYRKLASANLDRKAYDINVQCQHHEGRSNELVAIGKKAEGNNYACMGNKWVGT